MKKKSSRNLACSQKQQAVRSRFPGLRFGAGQKCAFTQEVKSNGKTNCNGRSLRQAILRGVNILADAVKITLGPPDAREIERRDEFVSVVESGANVNLERASRNIYGVTLVPPTGLEPYDLLRHEHVCSRAKRWRN